MRALVVGGTGATGKVLIAQLLQSNSWDSVVSIARRKVEIPLEYKNVDLSKLKEQLISLDDLEKEARESFKGVDVVFCTLGTTRAAAGSAEAFLKVDLEYVQATAKLAKEAGVRQFSLLSAQGANANIKASHLKPFHALLYAQTKGKAEEFVKAQGFHRVSIFQPGLLIRDEPKTLEKVFSYVVSSIDVKDVARAMIKDAESKNQGVGIIDMKTMQAAAKSNFQTKS